ncbi:hypothetical protein [Serratia marcescens]|uniref:hypothetical protein n=1 Tax=Serratia marcescens TaxID=615 RepID=UPI0015941362|nr:hypothetical protein [Serratia marcescens]
MSDNVKEFTGSKVFQQNQDLFEQLSEVIDDFKGKISMAEAIGVLEMLKLKLIG